MNKFIQKVSVSLLLNLLLVGTSYGVPDEPLLQQSNLAYKGAFRVPKGNLGGESIVGNTLSYNLNGVAYNSTRNSMLLNTKEKLTVEITIPVLVDSTNMASLQTATVVQVPADLTSGTWSNLGVDGAAIVNGGVPGGLLVYNNKLIGTSYGYYDGTNASVVSHFTASTNWASDGKNFSGFLQVGEANKTGVVAGYMAEIPPLWRSDFGGPALTGLGVIAIITRSSFGPAVSVFDPDQLGVITPVPATSLVQYPAAHTTLGTYSTDTPSMFFNRSTELKGLVFPQNARSVLFFGRHGLGRTGLGDSCYGPGTPVLEEHGRTKDSVPNTCNGAVIVANMCCYDPTDSSKGVHGYPYVYQVWAYDALDLLNVKNGTVNPATGQPYQPWEIIPYAVWHLNFPLAIENAHIIGAGYDPVAQRIYLEQSAADRPELEPFPLIQVFDVQAGNNADTTAPAAVITSPVDFSKVLGTISISTITKDNVGVTKVELYVDGNLENTATTGPFTLSWNTVPLAINSSHTLTVKAYDAANNVGLSSPIHVTVSNIDTILPTVNVFNVPANSSAKTFNVTFNASDNVGVTGYCIATTSSFSGCSWSGAAPTLYTVLVDGTYTLYPWAKDAAGLISTPFGSPRTVVVDSIPPNVTSFTAPSYSNTLTFNVTYTASDETGGSGLSDYCISTSNTSNNCTWESTIPTSYTVTTAGTYTLYPWARDKAGNISALFGTPRTVIVDKTPPNITAFTAPAYTNGLTFNVTYTASDETGGSGLADYCISTSNTSNGCTWNSTIPTSYTVSTAGTDTFYPWARDKAGNISALFGTPRTVIADQTLPNITAFTAPAYTNGMTFNVTYTASDETGGSGLADYCISTSNTSSGCTWNSTIPTSYTVTTAGTYTLYPWARDKAGNISTLFGTPRTVIVDKTSPNITAFTAPVYANGLIFNVTYTASDETGGSGLADYCISTSNSSSGCTWKTTVPTSYTVSFAGAYTLYPWARDKAGNISALFGTPRTVIVDKTPPNITAFTAPAYTNGLTFNVTYTASDETGGSVLSDYCISTSNTSSGCTWNSTIPTSYTVTTAGTYTFYPWARDKAGNISALFGTSRTVIVDKTPPTVTLAPVASPTILTSQTLTGTLTDNFPGTSITVKAGSASPLAATVTGTNWAYTVANLSIGNNIILASATDAAGNITTAPTATIKRAYAGADNTDGTITITDALQLLKYVLGFETPTAEQFVRTDVAPIDMTTNQSQPDGKLDIDDIIEMLRRTVGLQW